MAAVAEVTSGGFAAPTPKGVGATESVGLDTESIDTFSTYSVQGIGIVFADVSRYIISRNSGC